MAFAQVVPKLNGKGRDLLQVHVLVLKGALTFAPNQAETND